MKFGEKSLSADVSSQICLCDVDPCGDLLCGFCRGIDEYNRWDADSQKSLEELVQETLKEVAGRSIGSTTSPAINGLRHAMENLGCDLSDDEIAELLCTRGLEGFFEGEQLRGALQYYGLDFIERFRAAGTFE